MAIGGMIEQSKHRSVLKLRRKRARGSSLIKELRLLKNHFTKMSTPLLLTKDGRSSVTSDDDKCKLWVEHFEEVVNCTTSVNEMCCTVPAISPREDSSVLSLNDDHLGASLA